MSNSLADQELALVWGAWVELGVSGWQRTHSDWVIDPEPLIIRTSQLFDDDDRLGEEALDWCIHFRRYVSAARLRNLLEEEPEDHHRAWGEFAATVNAHSKARWPAATTAIPYRITGRSSLRSMDQPSAAWLRLRAMFGLGARTEVLRFFLANPRRATVSRIAEYAGYNKRVVADECESLERAGVLRMRQIGNRFYYSLARRRELMDFTGEIGSVTPDWGAVFRITSALTELEKLATTGSMGAVMVESKRVADRLDDDLDILEIEDGPRLVHRDQYWPAVRDFAHRLMSSWAAGDWEPSDVITTPRLTPRAGRRSS